MVGHLIAAVSSQCLKTSEKKRFSKLRTKRLMNIARFARTDETFLVVFKQCAFSNKVATKDRETKVWPKTDRLFRKRGVL